VSRRKKTETYCELAYQMLLAAKGRIPADILAAAIGCSRPHVYMVVNTLRRLLESTSGMTISCERGIGYRLAGMVKPGVVDNEQKANDTLSESTKSAMRGISNLLRQRELLTKISKEDLKDPDRVEEYALNVGIRASASGVIATQNEIQNLMSRRARKLIDDSREQVRVPAKAFGLMSFEEMIKAARSDDNDDDDGDLK